MLEKYDQISNFQISQVICQTVRLPQSLGPLLPPSPCSGWPLLNRNIPLIISRKCGLRNQFWPLGSRFLMRKGEKKTFLKTLSTTDFDLLESNSIYIFVHLNKKSYHRQFFFSSCMFRIHVLAGWRPTHFMVGPGRGPKKRWNCRRRIILIFFIGESLT